MVNHATVNTVDTG